MLRELVLFSLLFLLAVQHAQAQSTTASYWGFENQEQTTTQNWWGDNVDDGAVAGANPTVPTQSVTPASQTTETPVAAAGVVPVPAADSTATTTDSSAPTSPAAAPASTAPANSTAFYFKPSYILIPVITLIVAP